MEIPSHIQRIAIDAMFDCNIVDSMMIVLSPMGKYAISVESQGLNFLYDIESNSVELARKDEGELLALDCESWQTAKSVITGYIGKLSEPGTCVTCGKTDFDTCEGCKSPIQYSPAVGDWRCNVDDRVFKE